MIKQDRWLITTRLEKITGLSNGNIATIINYYLGLHKVFAGWVARTLMTGQKRDGVFSSKANLALFNSNNSKGFLGCFITLKQRMAAWEP